MWTKELPTVPGKSYMVRPVFPEGNDLAWAAQTKIGVGSVLLLGDLPLTHARFAHCEFLEFGLKDVEAGLRANNSKFIRWLWQPEPEEVSAVGCPVCPYVQQKPCSHCDGCDYA